VEFPICKEVLRRHPFRLTVVDCGARSADLEEKWSALDERVFIHGFDADEAECERLNRQSVNARFYPLCLSSTVGDADFHVTRAAHSSSLYPPAKTVTRWKSGLDGKTAFRTAEYFDVVDVRRVRTTTLSAWADAHGISDIDFIKLDVQGAELDVLRGAGPLLGQAVGMEVEVEFVPLYEGQPLFADVDGFARQQGFCFYDFLFTHTGHYVGRLHSPVDRFLVKSQTHLSQLAGQLVTADALYFRDPIGRDAMPPEKCLKLVVLSEIYGHVEFAFELLAHLGLTEIYEKAATRYRLFR
jgi:FkbM family methyltransferase